MTNFVLELHYFDGTRQIVGPFTSTAAATRRGELLLDIAHKRIATPELSGLVDYTILPMMSP